MTDRKKSRKKKPKRRIRKELIIIAAVLIAVVFLAYKVPNEITNSKLTTLGYSGAEIKAIREQELADVLIEKQYYSEYLAQSIMDHSVRKEYLELYTVTDKEKGLSEKDFLLYARLMDAGYEQDQLLNLFQNLEFWEMTPLLVFDYQWNEPLYIEDCLNNRDKNSVDSFTLDGSYTTPYKITFPAAKPDAVNTLVNDHWYLPEAYVPNDLTEISEEFAIPGQSLRKEAAEHAIVMFDAGVKNGNPSYLANSYISYEDIAESYNYYSRVNPSLNLPQPGFSEYQTGLAISVAATYEPDKDYVDSNAYQWLKGNCVQYGFLERYPANKEAITGRSADPSFYRYVGAQLAIAVTESRMTYDEYYCLYLKPWDNEDCRPAQDILDVCDYTKK